MEQEALNLIIFSLILFMISLGVSIFLFVKRKPIFAFNKTLKRNCHLKNRNFDYERYKIGKQRDDYKYFLIITLTSTGFSIFLLVTGILRAIFVH